jgi:hypothetical protein
MGRGGWIEVEEGVDWSKGMDRRRGAEMGEHKVVLDGGGGWVVLPMETACQICTGAVILYTYSCGLPG